MESKHFKSGVSINTHQQRQQQRERRRRGRRLERWREVEEEEEAGPLKFPKRRERGRGS